MSGIRDRVEKQIDDMVINWLIEYFYSDIKPFGPLRNAILSITELTIVDREAELPVPARNDRHLDRKDDQWRRACLDEQQNMLKNKWVKEVDKKAFNNRHTGGKND